MDQPTSTYQSMEINITSNFGFYCWCNSKLGELRTIPACGADRKNENKCMNASYKRVTVVDIKNIPDYDSICFIKIIHCKTGFDVQHTVRKVQQNVKMVITHYHPVKGMDYENDDFRIDFHKEIKEECNSSSWHTKTDIIHSQIIKFPKVSIKGDADVCAICMGKINVDMCEILQCSHVFHTKCLWKYHETLGCVAKKSNCCTERGCEHGDMCIYREINEMVCPLCRCVS